MLRRLRGGIHFSTPQGSNEPIIDAPIPDKIRIPIPHQPFKASVQIGDTVQAGQILGFYQNDPNRRPDKSFIPIFSSLPGRVSSIDADPRLSGPAGPSVGIEVIPDGKPVLPLNPPNPDIAEILKWTGLVKNISKTRWVVLNATCDEPMISSSHRLLLEKTDEILSGVGIAMNACSADRAWIVLDQRHTRLVRRMRKTLSDKRLSIHTAPVRYPMNRDRLLGEIPGIDKFGDPWVLTVHQAFDFNVVGLGRPIVDRIVSVSGDGVPKPANVRIRIGTSLRDVITFCGADPADSAYFVAGNPLTASLATDETPIDGRTTGIVIFHGRHELPFEKPCISCSRCRTVCPAGLAPDILEKKAMRKHIDEAVRNDLRKCLQCGLCGFVCPSKRSLFNRLRRARSSFFGCAVE